MGPVILLITTFIWGTAFLAQKIGGETLGPVTITTLRNVLGGAFLLGLIALRKKRPEGDSLRSSVFAGIACGVPLFFAMLAQQIGIKYTTPGISAFLTTNYVLFVPLMAAAFSRQRPSARVFASALAALIGTGMICISGSELAAVSIGRGEAWTILCAFLFSLQMMAVDRYAAKSDLLVLSATQLLTCALLGLPSLLISGETASLCSFLQGGDGFIKGALSLVYLGIFSSGIAYTLQNVGQARTPAGIAAVLLSLESVFGALSGYVVLGDVMTTRQFFGCALVFAAALFVQIKRR